MWNEIQKHRTQFVLTLFSALLTTLAFPKADWGWLAWFGMVPFILAIRKANARMGFLLGFVFGMALNLGLVYWTVHTMHTYGHLPVPQAVCVLLLFSLYLALYQALFASVLSWLRPKPYQLIFMAPSLWVFLELLRARLFTGFPWTLLGYSQYDHPWVIQMADLLGVYGVSGVIVLTNTVLALALLFWADRRWQSFGVSRVLLIRSTAVLAVILIGVNGYGIFSMRSVDRMMRSADKATVAVVQGNIDQARKWDPRFQMLTTAKYRNLSLKASDNPVDLVIWPETATPFYLADDSILTKMVIKGVQKSGAHFIIGSPSFAEGKERMIYHNSAYMITPEGKFSGKYDKVHLVPFGEYVPMKRWLPFIKKMVAQVGDFKPGRQGNTLKWKDHQVGMLICYEVIFPGLARAMVQNGADLLVNITNDAWFGETSAAYQHFSMAVFRAVENRRYLARAANTGISGFIDANGRITQTSTLFTETTVSEEVAQLKIGTRYTQWGDWPMGLICVSLVLPFIIIKAGRRWPIIRGGAKRVDHPGNF